MAIGALALAVMTAIVVNNARHAGVPKPFKLTNGNVVRFHSVEFTKVHRPPFNLAPEDSLKSRLFPRKGAANEHGDDSRLAFWIEETGVALGFPWHQWFLTTVHEGFEVMFDSSLYANRPTATNAVYGISGAFSHRKPELGFRVYERIPGSVKATRIGEFTMANPAFLASTPGSPTNTAASNSVLSAMLVSFRSFGLALNNETDVLQGTEAHFVIREHGSVTTNWQPIGMQVTDTTGAPFPIQGTGGNFMNSIYTFAPSPPLWPDEMYRMRVEFVRRECAIFGANETWTIPNIPVPKASSLVTVGASTNLNGYKIVCRDFDRRALRFSFQPPLSDHRLLLLSVMDDHGRKINQNGGMNNSTETELWFEFTNTVKSIDVTVALAKSEFLEFTAKPAFVPGPRN